MAVTLAGLVSAGGQASLTEVVTLGEEGWQDGEEELEQGRFGHASVTLPLASLMCPDTR